MIDIVSYESIDGVSFGASEADTIARFGQPNRQSVDRDGDKEFYFSGFILRFARGSGGLRECTLLPGCPGAINDFSIGWTGNFLYKLAAEDPDLMEVLGFVVSLKLGVALSGFHDNDESQKAIHAFRRGDWDVVRGRMIPFRL